MRSKAGVLRHRIAERARGRPAPVVGEDEEDVRAGVRRLDGGAEPDEREEDGSKGGVKARGHSRMKILR